MPRAVDVRVVPLLRLVLDVRRRDGDAARLLLGRLVDLVERDGGVLPAGLGEDLGDGGRQAGLAVIDVADRADVDVRLGAVVAAGGGGKGALLLVLLEGGGEAFICFVVVLVSLCGGQVAACV